MAKPQSAPKRWMALVGAVNSFTVQLRNTRASLFSEYAPFQTCNHLSGSRVRSSSCSSRKSCGKCGLSDQLTSITTALRGGLSPRSRISTGSVGLPGFQLNHNSLPGLRMVGRNRSSERWLSDCASSTHAMSKPSSDLMLSAVWFCIPWNMITPPPGVRISASSTSNRCPTPSDLILSSTSSLTLFLRLFCTSRTQAARKPFCDVARITSISAKAWDLPEPRPPCAPL